MSQKSEKQKQAELQSDAIEMEQFKQGVTYGGSFEMENAMSDMTSSTETSMGTLSKHSRGMQNKGTRR